MAAKTVVTLTCDQCADAGKDNVAAQTVTVGGVEVDACPKHSAPLMAAAELLTKYGRPASSPRRKPRVAVNRGLGYQCGLCRQVVARGSQGWHARNKHDKRSGEIQWSRAAH